MGLLMVQGISKEEGCEDLALLILMSSKDNFWNFTWENMLLLILTCLWAAHPTEHITYSDAELFPNSWFLIIFFFCLKQMVISHNGFLKIMVRYIRRLNELYVKMNVKKRKENSFLNVSESFFLVYSH